MVRRSISNRFIILTSIALVFSIFLPLSVGAGDLEKFDVSSRSPHLLINDMKSTFLPKLVPETTLSNEDPDPEPYLDSLLSSLLSVIYNILALLTCAAVFFLSWAVATRA